MKYKILSLGIVSLVTVMMMAVYLFGLHHGRTGEGLTITNEAIAATDLPCKFRPLTWTRYLSGIYMVTISETLEPCLWRAGLLAVFLR